MENKTRRIGRVLLKKARTNFGSRTRHRAGHATAITIPAITFTIPATITITGELAAGFL